MMPVRHEKGIDTDKQLAVWEGSTLNVDPLGSPAIELTEWEWKYDIGLAVECWQGGLASSQPLLRFNSLVPKDE